MKKLLSYLGVLVLGILIGWLLIPEPVMETTVEQKESQAKAVDELNWQTEALDTLSGFMEGMMDDYDKAIEWNEEAIAIEPQEVGK